MHGLAGSSRWWLPVLPSLRERYDVRALDLRRTPLVGHSLGGLLCAQVAARRRVRKLSLVSPAAMPTGRPFTVELLALATTARTLRSPTLILWGERDRLVPRRLAEPWRDAIPSATSS